MTYLNEDTLVQQTAADYLHDHLRWDSVYAYNKETFGPDGLLGRNSDREVECKNIHKDLRHAYERNFADYKDTIPHFFHHNAIIMLANGEKAKIGSLTAGYEHFHEWKRLSESDAGVVDMETLLKGICDKKNFITYDDSSGKQIKVLAENHQYLGVNQVIKALNDPHRVKGKLGIFWHTQGSGKSYSMVFFTTKVHRKIIIGHARESAIRSVDLQRVLIVLAHWPTYF